MRKFTSAAALIASLLLVAAFGPARVEVGRNGIYGSKPVTAPAAADTEIWVFQPSWLASSGSPDYPASPDSVVSDGFLYATVDADDPTVPFYNSTRVQLRGVLNTSNLGTNEIAFFYWPLWYMPYQSQIVEAKLCMKNAYYAVRYMPGLYVSADTIVSDVYTFAEDDTIYNIHRANVTWEYVDSLNTVAWSPALSSRSAASDFGIVAQGAAPDSVNGYDWTALDITAAIDSLAARNFPPALLIPWFTEKAGGLYRWYCGPDASAADQPFLVVKLIRKPYRPWKGKPLAYVWTQDDLYRKDQMAWLDTFEALGLKATLAAYTDALDKSASYFSSAQVGSLYNAGHDVIYHSLWHAAPGGWDPLTSKLGLLRYGDCDSVRMEVDPDTFATRTGIPVSGLKCYSPPNFRSNAAVIDTIIAYDFLGSRSALKGTNISGWANPYNTPCGGQPSSYTIDLLKGNGESDIYYCGIYCNLDKIVGQDDERPSQSVIEARVDSVIADALARGDNPVIITYTHDSKTNTGWSGGIENDELGWLLRRFKSSPYVKMMTFTEAVEWYRDHHHPVPGTGGKTWR